MDETQLRETAAQTERSLFVDIAVARAFMAIDYKLLVELVAKHTVDVFVRIGQGGTALMYRTFDDDNAIRVIMIAVMNDDQIQECIANEMSALGIISRKAEGSPWLQTRDIIRKMIRDYIVDNKDLMMEKRAAARLDIKNIRSKHM